MKFLHRDWRPRHVIKHSWTMTTDSYCHKCGRGTSWPCPKTTWIDRVIVWFGGSSR